jgi:hypothetical protein
VLIWRALANSARVALAFCLFEEPSWAVVDTTGGAATTGVVVVVLLGIFFLGRGWGCCLAFAL